MKKRVRFTFAEWWNYWIAGKKYVWNRNTNEVHDLSRKHTNCHLELMTDKKYINIEEVFELYLLDVNADGCRFCYKEQDNG